jgi:hypothetical protein
VKVEKNAFHLILTFDQAIALLKILLWKLSEKFESWNFSFPGGKIGSNVIGLLLRVKNFNDKLKTQFDHVCCQRRLRFKVRDKP